MPRPEHNIYAEDFTFADGVEHLTVELRRLDLLIRLQVLNQPDNGIANPLEQFRGLVISEQEVFGLLGEPAAQPRDETLLNQELSDIRRKIEDIGAEIRYRRTAASLQNVFLPLKFLADIFRLDPFEEQFLIICLAPELNRKYEKLFGYIHDDITRKQPSIGLAMDLLCNSLEEKVKARRYFESSAPLFRNQLLHFVKEPSDGPQTMISRSLKIDERIGNFLLGISCIDSRLDGIVQYTDTDVQTGLVTLSEETQSRLRELVSSFISARGHTGRNLLICLHGPSGTGKKALAKSICRELGIDLLVADLGIAADGRLPIDELLCLIGREALLHGAALCLLNFDVSAANAENHKRTALLMEIVRKSSLITFLIGSGPWQPPEYAVDETYISLEFPMPDDKARKQFWINMSAEMARIAEGIDFGELAGKFRLTPGQMRDALLAARDSALWRRNPGGEVTAEDLHAACRNQSHSRLGPLLCKIKPKYGWKDIILPYDQMRLLEEICDHARYRHIVYGEWGFDKKLSSGKGLSALFSGPPGTGKTMAAEVMANELGLDLYKIDLSQVVSKYIGETEKNLDKIFQEAGTSNAVLFFDEADALFGKRSEVKDAHDRYANIETGYLLQKMEEYEGIAILATNMRSNMDEAFVRRMNFIVELPFPREKERRAIWEGIWPDDTPRSESLDLDFVAHRFEITGGNIRNIALAAAFMAANGDGVIDMKHLIHATRREYQKMGKIVAEGEFGEHNA